MSDVFIGTRGLRQHYCSKTFTEVEATTAGDKSTAILLCTMRQADRWIYLCNDTNTEVAFWLVHPDAPQNTGDYRLFWLELGSQGVLNLAASNAPSFELPAKTRIYVAKAAGAGAASSGKVRATSFG